MTEAEQPVEGGVSNRDVAKGAGTTLLARLGGVLDVITQPLYFGLFGLAGYGFYGALWAWINLIENVADLGMTSAMQRVIPQAGGAQGQASALRAAILLGLLPCILVAIIISIAAQPVASLFNTDERDAAYVVDAVRWFIWALPLWAFVEIGTSALRSKRLFGAEIRLRLFWEQIIRLMLALGFYFAGFGTMSLIYAHLLSLSAVCILCVRLLNQHFELKLMFKGPVRDELFNETLKAGLGVLPVNIVTRLFGDGPAIALNWILPGSAGAIASGLYIIARKISSIVQLVRTAFSYVLAPLASSASTVSKDQVANIYRFSTRLSIALSLPLGAVLAAMAPVMLPAFGPGADAAFTALVILIIARVVEAVVGAATPIQQVTARHMDQQLGSIVGLGIAALIAWGFVGKYGLDAMALAVAVGLIIAALLPLFQLHIIDKLHPFAPPFGRVAGVSGLVSLGGLAITLLIGALPTLAQEIGLGLTVAAGLYANRKLGLALVGLIGATWAACQFFPKVAALTPHLISFGLMLVGLVATLWLALRFALPPEDRLALGQKTARRLKLV